MGTIIGQIVHVHLCHGKVWIDVGCVAPAVSLKGTDFDFFGRFMDAKLKTSLGICVNHPMKCSGIWTLVDELLLTQEVTHVGIALFIEVYLQ